MSAAASADMPPGLVSVVIAAYEEEVFIGEAVRSVLAQTYEPVEVIVVDDGSEDRTAEIAASLGASVLRRPHLGPSAARNAGLAIATGEFWTIFDGDDLMPPERLERQVAYLQGHPEAGMVLGLTEAFVNPGEPRPPHFNPAWEAGPFPSCPGTMLARREVLERVGAYDEDLPLVYDVEWLTRAKRAGVVAGRTEDVCLRYRIHRRNATADAPAVRRTMLSVLRASLHRDREERPA